MSAPPGRAPSGSSSTGVVAAIIVVLLVVVLIVVLVLVICWVRYRRKNLGKKGIYSPRHFAQQEDTRTTDALELKYAGSSPTHFDENSDPFSSATAEKEAEGNLAPDPAPAPPVVAATPTEGELIGRDGAGRLARVALCIQCPLQ